MGNGEEDGEEDEDGVDDREVPEGRTLWLTFGLDSSIAR